MVGNMFPRKDAIQNRPTLDAKTVFRFGTFRTSVKKISLSIFQLLKITDALVQMMEI